MEIADHAGETNGPEPAEETGARQGRGEPVRGRTLTKGGEDEGEKGEEGGGEEDGFAQIITINSSGR